MVRVWICSPVSLLITRTEQLSSVRVRINTPTKIPLFTVGMEMGFNQHILLLGETLEVVRILVGLHDGELNDIRAVGSR